MNPINPINKTTLYHQVQANRAYGTNAEYTPRMGTDKADLSEDALSFAKVYNKAREMVLDEDTQERADKISQLKQQIDGGEYQVASNDVAARMLFQLRG